MTLDPDSRNTPTRSAAVGGEPRSDTTTGFDTQPSGVAPWFGPPAVEGEVGTLGPYRIVREVGRGGMGAVYEATDTRLGRTVALKVMLPQFAGWKTARERFVREGRATAGVSHDNVVTVYEADERDGVAYIAMQFLRGEPLNDHLKANPNLPVAFILRAARDAADGLAAAHRVGLVHRDVKPANLWVEPSGRVKVLDFGTAKPLDVDAELTGSGVIVGTPAYMPPEQARGGDVDPRADLFSLGAVLYRLSTGRLPFPGTNPLAVLSALANDQPTPIRELNPDIPPPLAELVRRLMAKNPDDRPATADQVGEWVRAIERGDDPFGLPVETRVEPKRPARKPPWWVWAVGLGFAGLVAVVAVVVIVITNKDGSQTKIEVPSGATVSIQTQREPTKPQPTDPAKPRPTDPLPPKQPPTDREAAEFVFKLGGFVWANKDGKERHSAADLPKGEFTLSGINLDGKAITDEGMETFRGCKGITQLDLYNTPISDTGLAVFKGRTNLTHLLLSGTKVTDDGLGYFKDCRGLQELHLYSTDVSDAGVKHFTGLTTLTALHLGKTKVTDDGLAAFKDCTRLKELHLYNTAISDAGVKHFAGCTGLNHFGANYTKLTDDGFAALKGCKRLMWVSVYGTEVSDTSLEQLKACKELRTLDVRDTKVTAAGVKAFHEAVPGCEVIYDGGVVKPKK